MTTKRLTGVLLTLFCLAAGGLRLLDLFGNTDPATGYLRSGGLAVRYALLVLPVLLAALAALQIPSQAAHRLPCGFAVLGFCGLLFSGMIGICLYLLHHAGLPELAAAALMLLGSLWFTGYVVRREKVTPFFGIAAVLGWLVVSVVLFCTKTASLHHLLSILELVSSLAVVLFLSGLLRSVYAAGAKNVSRTLFVRGMSVFYFGFCLLLPQEIWLWQHNLNAGFLPGKCVAAALLGITGLLAALYCLLHEGEPLAAGDPDAALAAFAAAERRLEQEEPAPEALDEEADRQQTPAPARPADTRDPQPQRWHSAASALYGGMASEPTAAAQQSAPHAAPQPVHTPEAAVSAPSVRPAPQPERPTAAQPQPSAAKKAAAPQQAAPSAAPSAADTLKKLDALLAELQTEPDGTNAPAASQTAAEAPAAGDAAASDGGKWVFRRG